MSKTPRIVSRLISGLIVMVILYPLVYYLQIRGKKTEDQYFTPGLALYNKGDYRDAEKDFQHITKQYFNSGSLDSRVNYQLGMCQLHEGQTEAAKASFQQAIVRGTGQYSSRLHEKFPDDPSKSKAEAALAWINRHPNWRPAAVEKPPSAGPPQNFPAAQSN